MTKEEAKEWLPKPTIFTTNSDENHPDNKPWLAYEMAIKSLEQEPILDKIKAEIEGLDANDEYWGYYDAIADVLEIIDEYKEESGEQGNE